MHIKQRKIFSDDDDDEARFTRIGQSMHLSLPPPPPPLLQIHLAKLAIACGLLGPLRRRLLVIDEPAGHRRLVRDEPDVTDTIDIVDCVD